MSKRRLSLQQIKRQTNKENAYRAGDDSNIKHGLVIKRYGKQALIEDFNRTHYICAIKPSLDSIIAGDNILWEKKNDNQGLIVAYMPRISEISRYDNKGKPKIIAANLSQLVIVIAPKPQPSWLLLDTYLVLANHLKLKCIIVMNKADLDSTKIKYYLDTIYAHNGYQYISSIAASNENIMQLKDKLQSETSVLVGQSGVGKSSLIKSIIPNVGFIETQAISTSSELGKHTTSYSMLHHLEDSGALIDSPGIRQLALPPLSIQEIAYGFREFVPFLNQCKYKNCNHVHTPFCAIEKALSQDKIHPIRFENYKKIIIDIGLL